MSRALLTSVGHVLPQVLTIRPAHHNSFQKLIQGAVRSVPGADFLGTFSSTAGLWGEAAKEGTASPSPFPLFKSAPLSSCGPECPNHLCPPLCQSVPLSAPSQVSMYPPVHPFMMSVCTPSAPLHASLNPLCPLLMSVHTSLFPNLM